MIQLSGQFVPVKLNAETGGASVARQYGVRGYPTILFINGAGAIENQIGGYEPPATFAAHIVQIAKAYKSLASVNTQVKAHPSDLELAGQQAIVYARWGDAVRAAAVLARAEKRDPNNRKGYLAGAYNALGAYYQRKGEVDKALPLFRKAAQTGKQPYDVAYAHLALALYALQQNRSSEAMPDVTAVLGMPDSPASMKRMAQKIQEEINRRNGH